MQHVHHTSTRGDMLWAMVSAVLVTLLLGGFAIAQLTPADSQTSSQTTKPAWLETAGARA